MEPVRCPVCNWRVCDSNKDVKVAKLSNSNKGKSDIVLKCSNCKSCLSVKISKSVVAPGSNKPS